jgi:hypothetical protein
MKSNLARPSTRADQSDTQGGSDTSNDSSLLKSTLKLYSSARSSQIDTLRTSNVSEESLPVNSGPKRLCSDAPQTSRTSSQEQSACDAQMDTADDMDCAMVSKHA